jgi:hypothetical protein
MKIMSVVAVLGTILLTVLPARAMVDPGHLILPGQSIGLVHLGEWLDDAEKVWGPPSYKSNIPLGLYSSSSTRGLLTA